jgi:hypothetical protein
MRLKKLSTGAGKVGVLAVEQFGFGHEGGIGIGQSDYMPRGKFGADLP